MSSRYALLAGPVAAVIFGIGIAALPMMIPGYSQVHQTVSEIGMVGSPARIPFTVMLCVVALCVLVFGAAVRGESLAAGHSPLAGYLTACMAISAAGVGIFAYPHPLHNYFGLSELVAYQAPLALAVTWRRDTRALPLVRLSWLLTFLVWAALALNLSVLDRSGALWAYERPFYGLVQRGLFAVWFVWCAAVGSMLFLKRSRKSAAHPSVIPT
jgi:hypothetical membrane protein